MLRYTSQISIQVLKVYFFNYCEYCCLMTLNCQLSGSCYGLQRLLLLVGQPALNDCQLPQHKVHVFLIVILNNLQGPLGFRNVFSNIRSPETLLRLHCSLIFSSVQSCWPLSLLFHSNHLLKSSKLPTMYASPHGLFCRKHKFQEDLQ